MEIIFTTYSEEQFKKILKDSIREEMQQEAKMREKDMNTVYLTRREVADKLRISLPTLNEYTKTGKLKGYRIMGRVLYRADEIDAALKSVEPLKYRRG